MFQKGTLSESHPFIQELSAFATIFGELSKGPVRSFNDMFSRYPAMMHLQEQMRNASSGREAYNIYLGRHGTRCSISLLGRTQGVIPDIADVLHFCLSRSSWSNKAIVPAVENGVFLHLLLVLLEIIEYITEIKLKSGDSAVFYCGVTFDQKVT